MVKSEKYSTLKSICPEYLIGKLVKLRMMYNIFSEFGGRHKRYCPICEYSGYFSAYGWPLEPDAMCPKCRSLGRHRHHYILVDQCREWIDDAAVLHFGAEPFFVDDYFNRSFGYVRASYSPLDGEVRVDMQSMQYPDETFDTIIAHHVLEHVPDDRKALSEVFRVLAPGGRALLSVPMVEAWSMTYENDGIIEPWDRDLHFRQWDHVRLYGRDIRDRIRDAGFAVAAHVAMEPEVSRYGLQRGETIFVATKPG